MTANSATTYGRKANGPLPLPDAGLSFASEQSVTLGNRWERFSKVKTAHLTAHLVLILAITGCDWPSNPDRQHLSYKRCYTMCPIPPPDRPAPDLPECDQ